jgi:type 1 glutamine amidotransferase
MKSTSRTVIRILALVAVLSLLTACLCSCKGLLKPGECPAKKCDKIKAVVVVGGHDYEEKPFFSLFDGYDDIEYTKFQLKDDSELFEDISGWDYDVIVLFNMTQKISPKRQENFIKLLNQGTGLVALHHTMCSWQDWPQYKKIIGTKYYLKETTEEGVTHPAATYKHDVDMKVHIEDSKHPITRGLNDFTVHDEAYKNCGFQKDNRILLTTDHPDSDKTIGWTRRYGKANVCTIQLGHGPQGYADPPYRELIARAIRWSAGKLK